MFITSKVDLPVLQVVEQGEGDKKKAISLPGGLFPAGRHEVERIFNPVCPSGPRWLVLKGTKIGHAELVWKRWQDSARGDRAVVITNEDRLAASLPSVESSISTELPVSEDSFTSGPGEPERGPHPDAAPPPSD